MSGLEGALLLGSLALSLIDLWNNRHHARTIVQQWRIFGLYFLLIGMAIALAALTLDGPKPPRQALAATIWLLCWIFLVTIRMARALAAQDPANAGAPILKLPRWVEGGLLAITIAGLAFYYGCSMFHFCS